MNFYPPGMMDPSGGTRRQSLPRDGTREGASSDGWEGASRFHGVLAPLQLKGMLHPQTTSVFAMERLSVNRPANTFAGVYDKLTSILNEENTRDKRRRVQVPTMAAAPSGPSSSIATQTALYRYLAKQRLTPIVLVFTQNASPPLNNLAVLKGFLEQKAIIPSLVHHSSHLHAFTFNYPPPPWDPKGRSLRVRFVSTSLLPRFSERDLCGLVAAFVGHQEWQFKSLPVKSPIDVAHSIRLFYVRYTDPQHEPAWIAQLPVKSWQISRSSRHQDFMLWSELHDAIKERLMRPWNQSKFCSNLGGNQA